jgi:uncharacterized membrane protein YebE (DUF533 family)
MTDSERAKAALAALADGDAAEEPTATDDQQRDASGNDPDYRRLIERATRATADIDAAAEFLETVGLERLEAAVETADREVSALAAEGRDALVTFERFRVAARGQTDA